MAFRVRKPDEEAITSTKGFAASVSSQLPSLRLVILLLMHWQMWDLDGLSDGVIHEVRRRKRDNEKMNPVVRANTCMLLEDLVDLSFALELHPSPVTTVELYLKVNKRTKSNNIFARTCPEVLGTWKPRMLRQHLHSEPISCAISSRPPWVWLGVQSPSAETRDW
jgi:hypothetical protein